MQTRGRGKSASNINININLKVDTSKHPQPHHRGRRIPHHPHELVTSSPLEPPRLNPTTHTLHKHLHSLQQHTPPPQHQASHRDNNLTQRRQHRRHKSKSLQNLKIKYYEHTPEAIRHSKSKSRSKSKSKSKSNKPPTHESPVPFRIFKQTDEKSSKSQNRSNSKSFSRSPAPLPKTQSVQIFKGKQSRVPSEVQSQKEMKNLKKKERQGLSKKPLSNSSTSRLPQRDSKKSNMQPVKRQKKLSRSSLGKPKAPKKQEKVEKPKLSIPDSSLPRGSQSQNCKIFHSVFLHRMATRIQSVWRGYRARKQFQEMLQVLGERIEWMKKSAGVKKGLYWKEDSSDNSIVLVEKETSRSRQPKMRNDQKSQQNSSQMFMVQLQKLRCKLQEQEGRFKKLAEQNSELKANLSRIHSETAVENSRQKQKKSINDLELNAQVITVRIESEENQQFGQQSGPPQKRPSRDVPLAINTEQSFQKDVNIADLKKKVEFYTCSPKSESHLTLNFNRSLIQQLFSSKELTLRNRLSQKSNDFKASLLGEFLSPRSFKSRCTEFEKKIGEECEQALSRYKNAERALMMVAELEPDQSNIENEDRDNIFKCLVSRKEVGVKVDEVQGSSKYHPIVRHHSHTSEEQDISELYHKAMQDGKVPYCKKSDAYLNDESQRYSPPAKPAVEFHKETDDYSEVNNIPRGFGTNLDYVRVFLISFCEYFKDQPYLRQEFLSSFLEETTYDKEDFLKLFRPQVQSPEGELMFPYYRLLLQDQQVIQVHMLNEFYSAISEPNSEIFDKSFTALHQLREAQERTLGYGVFDLKQVHDMAIIEALNDALTYQRPGGTQGSNLNHIIGNLEGVWGQRVRNNFSERLKESQRDNNIQVVLGQSISLIINNWASCLCGFINDDQSQQIEEKQIEMVRQKRLSMMLEKSLVEDEKLMTDMKIFYLNVKFCLSDAVFRTMLNQVLMELQTFYTLQ